VVTLNQSIVGTAGLAYRFAIQLQLMGFIDLNHGCNILINQIAVKEVNKSLINLLVDQ
jgi:hypothetical protein